MAQLILYIFHNLNFNYIIYREISGEIELSVSYKNKSLSVVVKEARYL